MPLRLALFLGVLFLVCGCQSSKTPRADSWHQVQLALDKHNDAEVIKACEAYFAALGVRDPDPARTELVQAAYKQAFVRWLVSLRGTPSPEDAKHIEKFKTFMNKSSGR